MLSIKDRTASVWTEKSCVSTKSCVCTHDLLEDGGHKNIDGRSVKPNEALKSLQMCIYKRILHIHVYIRIYIHIHLIYAFLFIHIIMHTCM
mgnify:CR=1 FL=1